MPRRRSLSPEFFKDEDLACLPFEARLLFQGLWCYADRSGRLEDRPKYLKAEIFAYDRVDVDKLLSLLANPQITDRPAKAFIRRYTVETRQYIEIIEFSKHQNPHPHEPSSLFPDLPLHVITSNDLVVSRNDTPTLHKTNDQGPAIRPMTKDQKGKTLKKEHPIPEGFAVSSEVAAWAEKNGFTRLDKHLDWFVDWALSKGKKYVDWDRAFRNAIRGDWAKLGNKPPPDTSYDITPTFTDEESADMCEHGWFRRPAFRVKHGDQADQECGRCEWEAKKAMEKGVSA